MRVTHTKQTARKTVPGCPRKPFTSCARKSASIFGGIKRAYSAALPRHQCIRIELENEDDEKEPQKPRHVTIKSEEHLQMLLPYDNPAVIQEMLLAAVYSTFDPNQHFRRKKHPIYGPILKRLWTLKDFVYKEFPTTDDEAEEERANQADLEAHNLQPNADFHAKVEEDIDMPFVKEEDADLSTIGLPSNSILSKMKIALAGILECSPAEPLGAFEHLYFVALTAQKFLISNEEDQYQAVVLDTLAQMDHLLNADSIYDRYGEKYWSSLETIRRQTFGLLSRTSGFANMNKNDINIFGISYKDFAVQDEAWRAFETAQRLEEEKERIKAVKAYEEELAEAKARAEKQRQAKVAADAEALAKRAEQKRLAKEKKAAESAEIRERRFLQEQIARRERLRKIEQERLEVSERKLAIEQALRRELAMNLPEVRRKYSAMPEGGACRLVQLDMVTLSQAQSRVETFCRRAGWSLRFVEEVKNGGPKVAWHATLFIDDKVVSRGVSGQKASARQLACQSLLDALDYI